MFNRSSGVISCLESERHENMPRHVTAAVQAMNIIPNAIETITGPGQSPTMRIYVATKTSFDCEAYECFLCRKSFRTLSSLNDHLNSAVHDYHKFRCPKCKTEFKLIAGFIEHLECGSCGMAKTTQIDNYPNDLTGEFSRLLNIGTARGKVSL